MIFSAIMKFSNSKKRNLNYYRAGSSWYWDKHAPPHMELCHSWAHIPIRFSTSSRITPDQIRERCNKVTHPLWLHIENTKILVVGEECTWLACQVSAAYHNWLAYNAPDDDGFAADMEEREARIALHMEEPSSEESDMSPEED
jgi:hypothetical protein